MTATVRSQIASPEKIRCAVIQLARLGDTLQTLMALRAAKQLYPGLEITFIARERFAAAARHVPWIEKVVALPTEQILGPILTGASPPSQGIQDLARWLAPIVQEPWDLVVNWTYSEASSYLAALMPARVKLGYTRRNDGTFACADGWSHYVQAIVQGKVSQNIHLTDIFTTQLLTALQIHHGEPAPAGNTPVTSKGFFKLELDDEEIIDCQSMRDRARKWIGIQLGAGHSSKCWPAESWAELAAMILGDRLDTGIVLLGGAEDAERAELFKAKLVEVGIGTDDVLSLVGKTDFNLWATIVGRCQWLMSGDTAAMHLASVLGTRVLNLSIGDVRFSETGPYGNGHYVVAPSEPNGELKPGSVYSVWLGALGESQSGARKRADTSPADVVAYRSRIRNTHDGGGVVYEPVGGKALAADEWTSLVMGHMARAWYCGWVPPVGQEVSREALTPTLIKALRELDESADVLSKICSEAQRTANTLHRRSTKLRSDKIMDIRDKQQLTEMGEKLIQLDQLIERLADTHAPLRAFSRMSKVMMHNLQGSHLSDLAKETAYSYRQLGEGVAILKDWIRHTLELTKPVAVQGGVSRLQLIGPSEESEL